MKLRIHALLGAGLLVLVAGSAHAQATTTAAPTQPVPPQFTRPGQQIGTPVGTQLPRVGQPVGRPVAGQPAPGDQSVLGKLYDRLVSVVNFRAPAPQPQQTNWTPGLSRRNKERHKLMIWD
jgi:hypothetical protein